MEDIAISTSDFSILTNPPVLSRKKEKEFVLEHLKSHFGKNNPDYPVFLLAETPEEEKTLAFEGGNVIRYGSKHFFVGLNERTNIKGFKKFQSILKRVGKGYTATPIVILDPDLHLKCFASYLGNGVIIGEKKLLKKYKQFDDIEILDSGLYGKFSNVVSVNQNILIDVRAPKELEYKLEKMGYQVYRTSNTEFCKVDGDITCRSLLV